MQALEFEAAVTAARVISMLGDTQNTNTSTLVKSMYGKETNRLYSANLRRNMDLAAGIMA